MKETRESVQNKGQFSLFSLFLLTKELVKEIKNMSSSYRRRLFSFAKERSWT